MIFDPSEKRDIQHEGEVTLDTPLNDATYIPLGMAIL